MERLFDLDFQLVNDVVLLAIAMFFLFLIMSNKLFNPELGIGRERIRIVGSIGLIYTWMDEPVDVVLGEILDYSPDTIHANPGEVHETFTVPFEYFMERAPKDSYTVNNHYIWGLTARFVNYIVKLCREGSK